ncbi:MAG: SMI1/KNR4 family protein [Planctomycetota bacterium]
MTKDDFEQIESSLNVELPDNYKELLQKVAEQHRSTPYLFDRHLLLETSELVQLNQQIWASTSEDWSDVADPGDYFYIGEDGCGNYHCIDMDDDETAVFFLCHDPIGFDEQAPSLEEFISQLAFPPPSPFD